MIKRAIDELNNEEWNIYNHVYKLQTNKLCFQKHDLQMLNSVHLLYSATEFAFLFFLFTRKCNLTC